MRVGRHGTIGPKRRIEFTSRVKRPIRMIGWRENVGLPALDIPIIKAKIDTGARTSALYAENIRIVEGGSSRVAFTVPYSHDGTLQLVECVAPMLGTRAIRNSGGVSEDRYIIKTILVIDRHRWRTEISLADRANMGFDLILGRTALRGHSFRINPARSFLIGDPVYKETLCVDVPAEVST